MNKFYKYLGLLFFIIIFSFAFYNIEQTPIYFEIPKGWDKPTFDFKKYPLTEEKFELGKDLFYDPILSSDGMISCASCHFQGNVFSHKDHSVSHGVGDILGERNSISLQNLAWSKNFMWDGKITNLIDQPKFAITNPIEMNETMENVVLKLSKKKEYVENFQKAFPKEGITSNTISIAISQFLVMIRSTGSKYDSVKIGTQKFTKEEAKGYTIFKNKCASCHKEPLFTNNDFKSNGLKLDPIIKDYGRMKVTNLKQDSLKFKVPSLRNIIYSMDYMHDGRFETLKEVLLHYNSLKKVDYVSNELKLPLNLSEEDINNLEAFLITLTDATYLRNEKVSFKRKKSSN
jgi:cytochrome c peroxidase